jgi:hypothetical protein
MKNKIGAVRPAITGRWLVARRLIRQAKVRAVQEAEAVGDGGNTEDADQRL